MQKKKKKNGEPQRYSWERRRRRRRRMVNPTDVVGNTEEEEREQYQLPVPKKWTVKNLFGTGLLKCSVNFSDRSFSYYLFLQSAVCVFLCLF